ncbi:MAG: hypothetical protein ACRCZP_19910 [Phycicoccus sp.]
MTTQERFATIRGHMRTDAAKVLVDIAEDLHNQGEYTESRMHIRQAAALDKQSEDGYTEEQRQAIADKLKAADLARELQLETSNVRPIRGVG